MFGCPTVFDFYNTDKTRAFPMVTQWVPLDSSNPAVRVTVYFKADDLRVEYQQTSAGAKMELVPSMMITVK